MLTAKQINWIASRPPDEDFRFRLEYGKTIVVVTGAGGVEIHMSEDGRITAYGLYGMIQWVEDAVIVRAA